MNFKRVGVTLEVRLHRFILKKEAGKKVENRRREPQWVCDRQVGHPCFQNLKKKFAPPKIGGLKPPVRLGTLACSKMATAAARGKVKKKKNNRYRAKFKN